MRAGVGIDTGLGLSRGQQRTLVQEAARLGFDSLWTPAGVTRSIFQLCRDWWEATREIVPDGLTVGTSVIPFPGWTVATLAAESASLGEATGGKFNLGIGLGAYPAAGFRQQFDLPLFPTLTYTREYMDALRRLLRGDKVDYDGTTVKLRGVQLGSPVTTAPVPVYLAAMGPQMLRLSGELSDGVTPNWSSAEEIPRMREHLDEGARRAGRDPAEVPFAQYIRICVDDDEDAARRAFATILLGYAMARPGQPKTMGYRAHFGRMGFEDVLTDFEARRDGGTPMEELVERVPLDLMSRVGYFGKPECAADAFRRLSQGMDEAMVRLITVRRGDLDACLTTIRACKPDLWVSR